jgi:hypothetical protein
MKRLLRILLNTATILSLLLCVATVIIWVRSIRVRNSLYRETTWHGRDSLVHEHFTSSNGAVWFTSFDGTCPVSARSGPLNSWNWSVEPRGSAEEEPHGWWFRLRRSNYEFHLYAPYWPLLTAALIPPLWWLAGWTSRGQCRKLGHCPVCGYDLRATPDRCPECGAIPPKSQSIA